MSINIYCIISFDVRYHQRECLEYAVRDAHVCVTGITPTIQTQYRPYLYCPCSNTHTYTHTEIKIDGEKTDGKRMGQREKEGWTNVRADGRTKGWTDGRTDAQRDLQAGRHTDGSYNLQRQSKYTAERHIELKTFTYIATMVIYILFFFAMIIKKVTDFCILTGILR